MLKKEEVEQAKLLELSWRFGQSYGGGPIVAQMVMHCLANRQRCGWGTWFEVFDKVPNFMAENELPSLVYPSGWDGAFIKLLHVVTGVFDGSIPDMSKGALYWADLNKVERSWFQEKIIDPVKEDGPQAGQRQHPIVANVNSLSFFR